MEKSKHLCVIKLNNITIFPQKKASKSYFKWVDFRSVAFTEMRFFLSQILKPLLFIHKKERFGIRAFSEDNLIESWCPAIHIEPCFLMCLCVCDELSFQIEYADGNSLLLEPAPQNYMKNVSFQSGHGRVLGMALYRKFRGFGQFGIIRYYAPVLVPDPGIGPVLNHLVSGVAQIQVTVHHFDAHHGTGESALGFQYRFLVILSVPAPDPMVVPASVDSFGFSSTFSPNLSTQY